MAPSADAKILCRTPTPSKQGTRIDRWKYDAARAAILKVVPKSAEGIEFKRLARLVASALPARDRKNLGSVSWYTTTVKLDMETRGEIERVAGATPQRLRRIK